MAGSAAEHGPWNAASITLLGPGGIPFAAASSDSVAGRLDRHQIAVGEGPSWDAVRSGSLHVTADVTREERWPQWSPLALELGIAATVSVPLFTDARLGAMALYSEHPDAFGVSDIERAQVLGAHVSVVVAHSRMEQDLWRAIDGRTLIGQAQGILMERYHLSGDRAFAVLRRYSQQRNVKLAVLAQQLVDTGMLASEDDMAVAGGAG